MGHLRDFLLSAALLMLAACSKDNKDESEGLPNPDNLIGGWWQLSETYISPGTLVNWEKVSDGGILIFQSDSSYEIKGSMPLFWKTLPVSGTGKLGMTKWGSATATYIVPAGSTDTVFFHPIRIYKDRLELAGFCFEGCVYRFRKIK